MDIAFVEDLLSNRHHRNAGTRLPIYTLSLPAVRAYIINSMDLISALQRQRTYQLHSHYGESRPCNPRNEPGWHRYPP